MYGIDSGICAMISFAESYSMFPYTLSTYTSLLGERVIIEEMECENEYAKNLIKNARHTFKNMAEGIMEKDGIAFFFHSSFLYIRPSHTEPVTRIYIIAREKQKANHLIHMIRDLCMCEQ
jgi:phosphomannomutase